MVKAKKSLGQNWLKSESAIKEIIKAADLKEGEEVLEIGPGRGVLTKALIAAGVKVLAIEKDDELIDDLLEKFAGEINDKKLFVAHGDILTINASKLFIKDNYKLVANIPYYITGQVIRKFLSEEERQPSQMVLMVQKEVAKRITGKKESLLSISVKVYGEPKYIKTVPAGAFDPKPNVDSAILLIANISRKFFAGNPLVAGDNLSEKKFFGMLKKGFSQKRKLLRGNLEIGEEILQVCNIPVKARAENLTIENWKCLIEKI
ncbi:MAG: 16S rRNA (adenine(1518)-N(6)/adenine(1519)-N(6))-dimethyltransferase RsmA [Candidatus Paceibacterota bacterium]|jgi:16S rRNA (adenine1518-N6/adenine1519-N6)-dimethyltransferase